MMKKSASFLYLLAFSFGLSLCLCSCATTKVEQIVTPISQPLVMPTADHLEGSNRVMHQVDTGLRRWVFLPAGRFWRWVVPGCVRESLGNFVSNLGYPLNLGTHLLAGEFRRSWNDTCRFGINTTWGCLGLFDPAANSCGIYGEEGSFGKTLARWGVGEGGYVELPVLGGGSLRQQTGNLLDLFLNPMSWVLPLEARIPLKGVDALNLSATVEPMLSVLYETNPYHYERLQLLSYYRETAQNENFRYDAQRKDWNVDESYGFMMFGPRDKSALHHAQERCLSLGEEGEIHYSLFPCKNPKRIVFLLPGISEHRLDDAVLGMAELLNQKGCVVLSLSSTFAPDFFAGLKNHAPAGYLPEDARFLAQVISSVLRDYQTNAKLQETLPVTLYGFSLGGLNTLFIAAAEKEFPELKIENYVAVDAPTDPQHALELMDEFYLLPQKWSSQPAEQTARVRNILMRLAVYLEPSDLNPKQLAMPLTHEESLFLMGANFRMKLAACLISQQKQQPTGLFASSLGLRRNAAFAEAMNLSYGDYMTKVLLPWYQKHGHSDFTLKTMAEQCRLKSISQKILNNPRVLIFQSANDPLLAQVGTLAGQNVIVSERGGHLGKFANPEFLQKLAQILSAGSPVSSSAPRSL